MYHFNSKTKTNGGIENLSYYATVPEDPPFGLDAYRFKDATEVVLELARCERYFKEIVQTKDGAGYSYSIIYWKRADAIRPWLKRVERQLPATIRLTDIVIDSGCFWPWLNNVFDARARGLVELPEMSKPVAKIAA